MNEMVGYVFGSLDTHGRAITELIKVQRAQIKYNKSTTFYALVTTIAVTDLLCRCKKQEAKIKALSKEIEELKEMKGE